MIGKLLQAIGPWGPVLFGIGFLAPLIAQSMEALHIAPPFGLPSIATGLAIGTLAGLIAKYRGSWV
ncbi:hypothetical protein [Parvibaculum sp.]|jgi:hypothetical protein|uniref:hypothetical protein n=1 Tax=Parvibaculum sp. TaxID=2024848 RepID=UPI000C6B4C21|nr:hypothetical protein [Parvibaculum sp.]MAM94168.1 hypothetical protein [Parvibaculum sp.]HCX68540.1 hypothetical protein [Rhodobiaceae bacterium]|tara:strand:- start:30101 stop:30298 length:198 start_codon:yes stop_codon:yes gene_type:complete